MPLGAWVDLPTFGISAWVLPHSHVLLQVMITPVCDIVGPVTLLRSLPWHWLLQQLKCQKHKGTAESTAWNSSLCTAQPLTQYALWEEEVERGKSRERDRERGEKEKGGKKISQFDKAIWQYFGAKVPPVNNTHNVLLKKQKCTCSSLAIGNNRQYTDKQILEHMFLNSLETAAFPFFFQVTNLLCRGSHLLVCTVLSHNKE